MKNGEKKQNHRDSDRVLEKIDRVIPGLHGFFRKVEQSKTFGPRITEIRKEIEKRFGKK